LVVGPLGCSELASMPPAWHGMNDWRSASYWHY
jgi:hypothetical protein